MWHAPLGSTAAGVLAGMMSLELGVFKMPPRGYKITLCLRFASLGLTIGLEIAEEDKEKGNSRKTALTYTKNAVAVRVLSSQGHDTVPTSG